MRQKSLEEELESRLKQDVLAAFKRAETLKKPDPAELFTDVYAEEPWNIREQRDRTAARIYIGTGMTIILNCV
ncbi:hypothetical protein EDD22DRAFT_953394 [Suillus occidentalis]|nr:hypothetical protein EDD22DRAFT_953394 [Suillus occidentalis]